MDESARDEFVDRARQRQRDRERRERIRRIIEEDRELLERLSI